ncbi:hypothetical protein [Halosolutus halophilus]|uniref:hypothetical protein n=1 Tax=Halosolutus halophilus TaxID=1552990 RepID=UPI0022351754|nr:hypothetical protein [Halosolutus halophilus]
MSARSSMRGPETYGYLPWIVHRVSALALVPLLTVHIGVQLYPDYGFATLTEWGIYGPLLDLTLALVLVHAFLGIRGTVIETRLSDRSTKFVVWGTGIGLFLLFVTRLLA